MSTTINLNEFYERPEIKKSNKNLGSISRNSMAPGVLYPLHHFSVVPGDSINVDIKSLVQTNAMKYPLMGMFKVHYDMYFQPYSAWVPQLRNNSPLGITGLQNLQMPYFELADAGSSSSTTLGKALIGKSSLLEYLYSGQNWRYTRNPGERVIQYNAFPYLLYADAYINYYVNQNTANFPINDGSTFGSAFKYLVENREDFTKALNDLKQTLDWGSSSWYEIGSGNTNPVASFLETNQGGNLGGLFLRCYEGDRNTAFLSKTQYDQSRVAIPAAGSMEEFYTANKLYQYYLRLTHGNGRYREMIQDTFNTTPKILDSIPTLLGSYTHDLTFDTVMQTAPSADGKSFVGDRLGSGQAYQKFAKRNFKFNEYGTFMIIASIVPIVDYFQGDHDDARPFKYGDLYNPSLDGIGWQPLQTHQLINVPLNVNTDDENVVVYPPNNAIGYQPAWTQLTSKLNRVYGSLADDLRYITLSRDYRLDNGTQIYDIDTNTYIRPEQFNYPFADIAPDAENFQLQSNFVIHARRPMGNAQQPSL